ncbi:hypothetical protein [Cohnella sp. 56]|uniref:hypothetical protein n=1 Tax=Cohnella sp. 56 TaxID=3113722 RepID=UPI0030EAD4ED
MISGILDFIVNDLPDRTVHMTTDCAYGDDNPLSAIEDGTELTFTYGRQSVEARIRLRSGGECFHGSFEMGEALARRLGLPAGRRYKLTYAPDDKTMTIVAAPVSSVRASLTHGPKLGSRVLSIGYGLMSKLGLPESGARQGSEITVRHGSSSSKLRVATPSNLFDGGLRLHPSAAGALGLKAGVPYTWTYDQRARALVVGGTASRRAGGGDRDAMDAADAKKRSGGSAVDGGRAAAPPAATPRAPAAAPRQASKSGAASRPAARPKPKPSAKPRRAPAAAADARSVRRPAAAKPAAPADRPIAAVRASAGRKTGRAVPPPSIYMPKGRV